MKILVRATNWIGDAVMSLPALRAIRTRFPDSEIAVLARPWVAALYEGERSIDSIIPLEGRPGAKDWSAKWRMARVIRARAFDTAVLFPNSFESAALMRAACVKRVIGYSRDARGMLLTQAIEPPAAGQIPEHERFYYLELLRRAGWINTLPESEEIRLDGTEAARLRGAQLLRAAGLEQPVIGISPGAAYGTAKRWLPERFAEAALRLSAGGQARVAVFGSAAEAELCLGVAAAAGGVSFAGRTTLREFIDMTAACSLFLSNDSGAMHIASALGIPSVTVFGPTNERGTGPLGPQARVIREPVECAPCMLRECPIDHRCMTRVEASRVIDAGAALRVRS